MTVPVPQPAGSLGALDRQALEDLQQLRDEFTRFVLGYKFGVDEVRTKISILQEEFTHLRHYNPIEHVSSRVKTPESILQKAARRGCGFSFEEIRTAITDIAGVRVTCSFVSDVYRVFDMLTGQPDLTVLQVKDYVAAPKPNGYRSLHALVEVPVHLSDRTVPVTVEVQFRTVAMDFWASLEHKIYYKYSAEVPASMREQLLAAATTAANLDERMEFLHRRLHGDGHLRGEAEAGPVVPQDEVLRTLHELREARDASGGAPHER